MKTIELQDEEFWMIEFHEDSEKMKYVFSDKVYSNLEMISIFADSSSNYPCFEGPILNAPNLKYLSLSGDCALSCLQIMYQTILSYPSFQEIHFSSTGITQIPQFLLKTKSLKSLTFRRENLSEIPDDLFKLEHLQKLSFEYFREIKTVPDKIKNLVNLKHFDLWMAQIEYLSPELFLLPQIRHINFAYSEYSPTEEVLEALKKFKSKDLDRFSPWENFNS
jgi:hypothetical protein